MESRAFITPIGQEGMYVLDTASWRTLRPVMDKEKCVECGLCMAICPVMSILRDENKKHHVSYVQCKGCGLCAKECGKKAIEMQEEGCRL